MTKNKLLQMVKKLEDDKQEIKLNQYDLKKKTGK